MATVAKAEPGTVLRIANETFVFEDGTRQVNQSERELLESSGAQVTFEDQKKSRKGDK